MTKTETIAQIATTVWATGFRARKDSNIELCVTKAIAIYTETEKQLQEQMANRPHDPSRMAGTP